MKFLIAFVLSAFFLPSARGQAYQPRLELAPCPIKVDARLLVKYGYLVVPENRQRPRGRQVKVPFLFVRRPNQDAQRNILLYSPGGPGYSAIAGIDSIGYASGLLKYGGTILFDQRGTKLAQPCLACPGVDEAIKRSYRTGLSKDSLVVAAARECRKQFTRQGIDLSAYNTVESAEDINDLRRALQLDSLNLLGISYSGGLMLTVARNHPEAVRALLLNSPLPGFARYEDDGLLNINEALEQVFADNAANPAYLDLRSRFRAYFSAITGKRFTVRYQEKGARDSLTVTYTKQELLSAVLDRLNGNQLGTLPAVIADLLQGRHQAYVREQLDGVFAGNPAVSLGMRYSVHCSEQMAYAAPAAALQQSRVLPWLAGYEFNDVTPLICSCWQVKPESATAKTPVYSTVPALLVAGDVDPWCRPFYNRLIKRYLPNSQLLTQHNQGHAPGYTVADLDYAELFLAHPTRRLVSRPQSVIIE